MSARRRFPLAPGVHPRAVFRLVPAVVLVATVALAASAPGHAFDELNPAQSLVYDTPHLATTEVGDEIVYDYRARVGEDVAIRDGAALVVDAAPDAERRDVTLDFLSDERRLELPPFSAYRGNPVLIATLEHLAQTLSAATGGGALYMRNRIRDALARDDLPIEHDTVTRLGEEIETTTLAFQPFRGDPYLGARPGYAGTTFRLVFSDGVPGGVLSIGARSGDAEEPADATLPFDYELSLVGVADGS